MTCIDLGFAMNINVQLGSLVQIVQSCTLSMKYFYLVLAWTLMSYLWREHPTLSLAGWKGASLHHECVDLVMDFNVPVHGVAMNSTVQLGSLVQSCTMVQHVTDVSSVTWSSYIVSCSLTRSWPAPWMCKPAGHCAIQCSSTRCYE
jgi:hypothetical protein